MMQSQRILLTWLVEHPGLYQKLKAYIEPSDFTEGIYHQVAEELFGQFECSMQSYVRSFDIAGLVDGLYRIVQENEAVCRVLLFGRRSTELIHRMIAYAHDLSISAWRKTLKNASADELEMLYLCLSNGLLSVVLDGYDRFERQTVIRFVDQMYRQAIAPFM